jgi:hypothetical protein
MNALTETPELVRFADLASLGHEHPKATTFAIFDKRIVLTTHRTHPYIFNAVKAAAADPKRQRQIFKNYGIQGVLDEKAIQWFMKVRSGEMGKNRRVTLSGRVWKDVTVPKLGKLSAVSFWEVSRGLTHDIIDLVARTFKLKHPIYIEGVDSTEPILWPGKADAMRAVPSETLRSKVNPKLTSKQIADILSRAHAAPHTLDAREAEVVHEFRHRAAKPSYGFPSRAELNFRKTVGEACPDVKRFLGLFD